MRPMNPAQRTAAAIALTLAVATTSQVLGQTILLDFGTASTFRGVSTANPDANGNTWNNIATGVYYPSLASTSGASTGIGFGFSTGVNTDSFNGPAGATSTPPTQTEIDATDIDTAALGDLGVKTAAIDFFASTAGNDFKARFEVQNLNPVFAYDLTFFGSRRFAPGAGTVYTVYSDNTYGTVVATGTLNVQDPASPWLNNRSNTLTLSSLLPQAANILYVEFSGLTNGTSGSLNALRITGAPAIPTYNLPGSGQYDTAGSWRLLTGGAQFPSGVGATAIFGPSLTRNATVFTETDVTLGRIDLNSSFRYELAGPNALRLEAAGAGTAQVNVLAGTHKLNLATTIASNTAVTVASGAGLVVANPLTINAGLTLSMNGAGSMTIQAPVAVNGAATLKLNGGTVSLDFPVSGGNLAVVVDPATLNLGAGHALGALSMELGSNTINVGVTSTGATVAASVTATSLAVTGGPSNVIHTSPGSSLTTANNLFVDAASDVTVTGSGSVHVSRVLADGAVAVTGGTLELARGSATSAVTALSLSGTGVFDVTNNDLVVRTASPEVVNAWISEGRLVSSSAGSVTTGDPRDVYATLAVLGNTDAFGLPRFGSFAGIGVAPTDTLLKYTYAGDTDLDGVLDARDFIAVLNGFSNGLGGWQNGDIDRDGVTSVSDWSTFLAAYTWYAANGTPLGGRDSGAMIPEPAALACLLPALTLVRRRR